MISLALSTDGKVSVPGFWSMRPEHYHADPTPGIALSNGIICTLINETPLHARVKHPKLNPHAMDDVANKMDVGSVIHKLALDEGAQIEVIDAKDWRTKAAKEAREAARHAGKIPILGHKYEEAQVIAKPLRAAMEECLGRPMAECLRETVIVWQRNGLWCKAMIDVMTPDALVICDAKTTEASVNPQALERQIYANLTYIQNAFYFEGLDDLDPDNAGRRRWFYLYAEQASPFAVSPPIEISEAGLTLASEQIAHAADLWAECLETDTWPSYGSEPVTANPPPWMLNKIEEAAAAANEEFRDFKRRDTRDHLRDLEILYARGAAPQETEA